MKNFKICSKCVMNTTALDINFNEKGICNYCIDFEKKINEYNKNKPSLDDLISKIKKTSKGNKYDCIIGLSGGVDSCFSVHNAVEKGLNPLVVHLDNGWNSELAQNNIENLIKKLDVDLFTHVVNWNEYKNLMNAFFRADVLDVELLMDNAMLAINYQQASVNNLNFILAGTNISSEGMAMPKNMNWFKYDKKNIIDIAKKFGDNKINTYPIIGTYDLVKYIIIKKIKWISFLDYFDYNKFKAINLLKEKYNFKPYPYKHYESVFTRFYQGYILPYKFGVDKRILHYSTLIISNQIKREDALKEIQSKHAYPSEDMLEEDKEYFLKKMNWTSNELETYIKRPPKRHDFYKSEKLLYETLLKLYKVLKF